jgi:hypothetical protein
VKGCGEGCRPVSQGKGFLPVYVQEPHFIMGFGTRRIVCIRFRAEPSCPHFISEAGVQCAASCIDAVKEAYFHGGGVHGLYGDFHIVDEVVGVSFGEAYVPAVFFVFGASHDMAEGEFGDAGFPAADEVIGIGFYGPVVSVTVVTQGEGVPSSGDGVGNVFFASLYGINIKIACRTNDILPYFNKKPIQSNFLAHRNKVSSKWGQKQLFTSLNIPFFTK